MFAFVAAAVVFCVVQDRVTAAGVRQYVALQREAIGAGGPVLTIEEVMRPARRRSVEQGVVWGGLVAAIGLGGGTLVRRLFLGRLFLGRTRRG